MSPRSLVLTAAVLISAGAASPGLSYDTDSHEFLGVAAARRSTISERLQQDLGLSEGRQARLRAGKLFLTIEDWVGHGAREEDLPLRRVFNHFHNPLRPWRDAGLSIARGDSSVLWSQAASQSPGGTWTWAAARRAFLDALTLSTPDSRERRLADTFDTLGHLTHLVQDASVPAHTRNDAHPSIPVPFLNTFIPLNSDWYEDWVEDTRLTDRAAFDRLLALSPTRPLRLVLHSSDPAAPVGIAGLIDTDQLMADGPAPSIFGPASSGIAEFTNANFLSRDTLFTGFARPTVGDLGPGFYEDERGAFRQYFPKVVPGTAAVEVPHFVAEAALTLHLKPFSTAAPQRVMWRLTPRVHEDYARELIPRAIGYSAELIDYFFRGRLDVDVSSDPFNPALVRISGTNASPEPLFQGTLMLYADTAAGQRVQAPAIDAPSVVGIAAGTPLFPVRFEPPPDTERFVAIYQGALGLERPGDDFPGAVIGKVIGGLRVEEVFAQGERWRLRTPRGVFDLPLATATYDEVKWGDGDHVLVARTPLDADLPFVDTFEIVRRQGSIEPVLGGNPPMVELRRLGTASLAFVSAPLVTTITFDHTTAYRQQIGRYREVDATRWVDGSGNFFYESGSRTTAPIAFETVHAQDVVFAATVPVRLDAAHNLDLGTLDDPYYWFLADVTADRDGRILGLAVIALTQPPVTPATVPWFRLDSDGQAFVASTIALGARFPENMTTIWALVDLGAGEVVAATAEPTVSVSARHASEGPPWDSGGASFAAFPGVYRDVTTTYAGGPRDGQADRRVDAAGLGLRRSTTGIVANLDARTAEQTLSVAGWFRPEIKAALTRSSLGSFDAGDVVSSATRWNYACVAAICTSSDDDYVAFEVRSSRGGVLNPPAELIDARRARPAPAGERLVLLGDAFRATSRPIGSVVAWDIAQRTAREALAVPDSFHDLGGQAATSAVLLSYRPRAGTGGTFLVPLDEGGAASFFADEELLFDFAMVGANQLYNVRDSRFYRPEPPLRTTPLPARLAPLSPNLVGDYHAIRVP
jgi:hypothetical protein